MSNRKGLTLIELLVSSAIFAVVMLSIYSAFQSGVFSYRNIGETIDTYQSARAIMERINTDLRNSLIYLNAPPQERSGFLANETELGFFCRVDRFFTDTNVQDYAYVNYRFSGSSLSRKVARNLDAVKDNPDCLPEEMAGNLSKLVFSYFYFDPNTGQLKEKNSWGGVNSSLDEQKKLPLAVKVSLVFKGKSGQVFERKIYLPMAEK